jgi:hypothetical protein
MSRTIRLSAPAGKRAGTADDQSLGDLVMLKHYCAATGDTPHAVHGRRRKGQWIDGVHCYVKSSRRLWINTMEVKKWIVQQ